MLEKNSSKQFNYTKKKAMKNIKKSKQKMFYVKLSFGQHLVMDYEENKMVVGYSKKSEAETTANGLNRIRKKENIHKMKETLQTLEGYGHYVRLAKKKVILLGRFIL